VLSDILTIATAAHIIAMVKARTFDIYCITGGPKESDNKLEDSFLVKTQLSNPEDKSLAKDVAQKMQKFYFRDKSNTAAVFSSAVDVRNDFLFCSPTSCISVKLGFLQ
jgi:hypothetical protein